MYFYLIQHLPILTHKSIQSIEKFISETGLRRRFTLEVRKMKWFDKTYVLKGLHITRSVSIRQNSLRIYLTQTVYST